MHEDAIDGRRQWPMTNLSLRAAVAADADNISVLTQRAIRMTNGAETSAYSHVTTRHT